MRSRASSISPLPLKVPPPFTASSPDIPDIKEDDIKLPLTQKRSGSAKITWSADALDLFVLLCSFFLITASIVLVALVFNTQANWSLYPMPIPREALLILQRVISSLSVVVASAVIMVVGKRYVLFKLARGGLRSRRVAVYSDSSIGNLARYLVLHGAELPLLGLSAVWGLALVTSLTVNNSWEMGSISATIPITVPSGPLDPTASGSSWIVAASEQLTFVMSSLCFGVAGTVGLVNITNASTTTEFPTGIIYYPPIPYMIPNVGFSLSTTMNGFNISMERLSSVPSTAQNLTCAQSSTTPELWYDGSDNQTLSIIVVDPSDFIPIFRFNATAIIMGGTLSSTGSYTEFALNGTSWPNMMSANSQWAQDITGLICNTTLPPVGACYWGWDGSSLSLSDFAGMLNSGFDILGSLGINTDGPYTQWSTILSMALGAYSFAKFPNTGDSQLVPITQYDAQFTPQYGIYVLIVNIIVSLIMLIVAVKLRLASHLGADFMNSTRLLLDPLKNPELFDASLKTTVDALADPHMLVRDGSEFLLVESELTGRRNRLGKSALRRSDRSDKSCNDSDTLVAM